MEELEKFLLIIQDLMSGEDLSFEGLAKKIPVSSTAMRHWKKGNMPSVKSLKALSGYFDYSIDFLLGMTEVIEPSPKSETSNFLERYEGLKKEKSFNDYYISQKCQIGSGTPTKWKEGRVPDTAILISLCKIFECSFEYLIGRSD